MTLTGLYVPLITPFDSTGAVAPTALEPLAHRLLDDGATGLVALGTTGEPGALDGPERRLVVDLAARVCRERGAPLLVGANTPEELAALAGRPEVAAALCVVPPFTRPGQDAVLAHFARLASASPVPLVAYDVPYRTGQYLSAGTLRRLAAVPGVVGLKYAPGGINADTVALFADPPAGFALLGGDDPFIAPLLALGAQGGILASAHLATTEFAALIRAWHEGDVATARPLGRRLATLSTALFAEPNPTVIKAVLHARGHLPTAAVRPPLLPAAAGTVEEALHRLDELSALTNCPARTRRSAPARIGGQDELDHDTV
ncbi:dihydrodipicolinate synthase family protein [Rugosimonospora acidiphila]